jgi:arsenite-transporting ATPase
MNSLEQLLGEAELIAFTGKGGVGKTTCSAATAIRSAEDGHRTLLLSTDRSPSLSDVLGVDAYGKTTAVPDVNGLDALELDFEAVADRWKSEFGEEVYAVISSFMPVDRWVIDYVAEAPGIGTQFALSHLLKHFEESTYDRIVWDTAPAGATIGLVELEEKLYDHLGKAPRFYAKLRGALRRDVDHDPAALISEWRTLAADCLAMVRSDRTAFVVVTNPEKLAVEETDRIVSDLDGRSVSVSAVVVNRLLSSGVCDCAFHQSRVEAQREHLADLEAAYGEEPGLAVVPLLSTDVDDRDRLRKITAELFDPNQQAIPGDQSST